MEEIRVLTPCGGLGYGFPKASVDAAMAREPHVIAVDAGSTDPGPYYLGSGEGTLSRDAQKNDLTVLMTARHKAGIPLVVGTAYTAGAKPHVDKTVEIVREIAAENGFSIKLAIVPADMDKSMLKESLANGRVRDFEHPVRLDAGMIERSRHIVAQMGVEPIVNALKAGADVVVAGRSYDPAIIAALPIMHGFDPGLAIHMGKILECGAYAAEPQSGADAMFGTIRTDHFEVEPPNPSLRCTVDSVAAHTLYEKESPVELHLPGGMIDLSETTFEAVNDRAVRVAGTRFHAADQYTLKLEGAEAVGFRSLFIAGARDPVFIAGVDEIIADAEARVKCGVGFDPGSYRLNFRIYGKNGILMGPDVGGSPSVEPEPVEIGIVGEVVADTQEIAHSVCSFAHGVLLHSPYPGRKTVAGNLAFPFSPSDFDLGEVFEFSIYHLLEVDDPAALFPVTIERI